MTRQTKSPMPTKITKVIMAGQIDFFGTTLFSSKLSIWMKCSVNIITEWLGLRKKQTRQLTKDTNSDILNLAIFPWFPSFRMINNILNISQAVLAVLLMLCVLFQARGTGLGAAFGGDSNVYRTKRGVEKKLFQATIVVVILFFGVSLANVLF